MTRAFDPEWSAIVCGRLDALFESTDAGFSRSLPLEPVSGRVENFLWEADALRFAERFPDSGVVESYGDQWPAPCIDYWVYIDEGSRTATLSVEGWNFDCEEIALSGDGPHDAERLHRAMASFLQQAPPWVTPSTLTQGK